MQRTMTFALIALAAAFAASPAAAQEARGVETISVPVSYSDLDLDQVADARTMLARVDAAAMRACGGRPSARDLSGLVAFRACTARATSEAVVILGRPIVTAEHLARGNRAPGRAVASLRP